MGHPNGHVGRWQKKPVIVDALEFEVGWTGEDEIRKFFAEPHHPDSWAMVGIAPGGLVASLTIHTLEGDMKVSDGDFVIKGVHGEFYPCKPDIFEATYRPVV